jgi:perosamine synthetase
MPTGDGGMITTNNKEIMEKIKKLYWFGIESTYDRVSNQKDSPGSNSVYKWKYDIDILGYKYYMIDLTAALGLSQMNKLDENLKRRQFIQEKYNEAFSKISEIQIPPFSYTVQHYVIKVEPNRRDNLIDYLKDKNIHTSVHYRPLHLFTQFKDDSDFPIANREWLKMMTLPVHLNMSDEDIDYIIYWVKEFFKL